MTNTRGLLFCALAFGGLVTGSTTGRAEKAAAADTKLPEAVKKTFETRFPRAEIEKVDVEEEGGVTVYDIEFKEGATEKETDITADGIMLEYTVVIDASAVPAAAMKPIREVAAGATMKRIEEIKISHETKDGKTIKLSRTLTHYAVELKKGDQEAEIVVDPVGKVIEPANWSKTR